MCHIETFVLVGTTPRATQTTSLLPTPGNFVGFSLPALSHHLPHWRPAPRAHPPLATNPPRFWHCRHPHIEVRDPLRRLLQRTSRILCRLRIGVTHRGAWGSLVVGSPEVVHAPAGVYGAAKPLSPPLGVSAEHTSPHAGILPDALCHDS